MPERHLGDRHGTGDERFDLLYRTVCDRRDNFAKRSKAARRKAMGVAVGGAAATGATTVLLGLREVFSRRVTTDLITAAFILSAVGTVIAGWDGLFKHSRAWVQRTVVLNKLQRLELDMRLYAAGRAKRDVADADVEAFLGRLHGIDQDDIDSWLSIRSDITGG